MHGVAASTWPTAKSRSTKPRSPATRPRADWAAAAATAARVGQADVAAAAFYWRTGNEYRRGIQFSLGWAEQAPRAAGWSGGGGGSGGMGGDGGTGGDAAGGGIYLESASDPLFFVTANIDSNSALAGSGGPGGSGGKGKRAAPAAAAARAARPSSLGGLHTDTRQRSATTGVPAAPPATAVTAGLRATEATEGRPRVEGCTSEMVP